MLHQVFHQIEFKKEVVNYLLQYGIKQTLQKYNTVSKSTIYYWLYKLNQIARLNNNENNLSNFSSYYSNRTRIDPRMIIFIKRIKETLPIITRSKIKQLCNQYSYINNTSYISVSSIGRILKKIKEDL